MEEIGDAEHLIGGIGNDGQEIGCHFRELNLVSAKAFDGLRKRGRVGAIVTERGARSGLSSRING